MIRGNESHAAEKAEEGFFMKHALCGKSGKRVGHPTSSASSALRAMRMNAKTRQYQTTFALRIVDRLRRLAAPLDQTGNLIRFRIGRRYSKTSTPCRGNQ